MAEVEQRRKNRACMVLWGKRQLHLGEFKEQLPGEPDGAAQDSKDCLHREGGSRAGVRPPARGGRNALLGRSGCWKAAKRLTLLCEPEAGA